MGDASRKKIAFVIFFFSLLLFSLPSLADSTSTAIVVHAKGTDHFSQEKYEQALELFQQAYKLDPQNDENNRMLGLTYLKLERYTDALNFFKKVEKLNPDSKSASFAREWIAKLEESKAPPGKKREEIKRWNLQASSSFYYDSNATQDPDNENLTAFPTQQDYLSTSALDFKYLLLSGEKTKFYLGYSGYQSLYLDIKFDSDSFDYGRHKGNVEFIHRINDYLQWRVPVYYSYSSLGKSKYVQSVVGETALDMAWMNNFLTTITGGARWDNFFATFANSAQDRDANQPYAKIEQYYFAPHNRDFYIKAGFLFEKNMATGADWDYNAYHLLASIHSPLPWKMKFLFLSDTVARRNFKSVDSVFNVQRKDESGSLTGSISREIIPHLTTTGSYTFFIQDSNTTRFSHRRHVAGLTLSTNW